MSMIWCWIQAVLLEVGLVLCVVVPLLLIVGLVIIIEEAIKSSPAEVQRGSKFIAASLSVIAILFIAGVFTFKTQQKVCALGFTGAWHSLWAEDKK